MSPFFVAKKSKLFQLLKRWKKKDVISIEKPEKGAFADK
jgi:hypothetical protein